MIAFEYVDPMDRGPDKLHIASGDVIVPYWLGYSINHTGREIVNMLDREFLKARQ